MIKEVQSSVKAPWGRVNTALPELPIRESGEHEILHRVRRCISAPLPLVRMSTTGRKRSSAGRCGSSSVGVSASPVGTASIRTGAELRVSAPTGERRHLTVLFCDLVGSTAIAARLDPEEWRRSGPLAGFHRTAAEAITRFDGHVAKNLGDGLMAYFGWPAAHDNDAERAARAGLAMLDAIAKLNEQPGHATLAVRIGIDSGLVVIGIDASQEAEVFGDTPNIAARVEAAAEPGTVAISDTAHRLVSGLFVVEDLGLQALKGIEQPVQLYRVVRPSGVRGRFQAATAAGGLTPFVGREDELRSLTSRWERVLDSEGQVALIIGEAGIGKSLPCCSVFMSRSRPRQRIPGWRREPGRFSRTHPSIRSARC